MSPQAAIARLALSCGIVLSILASCGMASAASADAKVIADRDQQVIKMSQIERDHLQRNWTDFKRMSEVQKDQYRELNRQLEENRSQGGHLSSLLQTYSAWLQTLTPGQREALRQEKDSAKKFALVRKFKDEQHQAMEFHSVDYPEGEVLGNRPPPMPKLLNTSEFSGWIKILVADLPTDAHEKLSRANRPEQFLDIIRQSSDRSADGPHSWPSRELQEKLVASIKRTELRNFIKLHPEPAQREAIARILLQSIRNQIHDKELSQILKELPADEQRRIENMQRMEKHRELIRLYGEHHGEKALRQFEEMQGNIDRMMRDLDLPPPPRFRMDGPPPRGPGDRGPGFGDGPPGPPPGPPPPRNNERNRGNKSNE